MAVSVRRGGNTVSTVCILGNKAVSVCSGGNTVSTVCFLPPRDDFLGHIGDGQSRYPVDLVAEIDGKSDIHGTGRLNDRVRAWNSRSIMTFDLGWCDIRDITWYARAVRIRFDNAGRFGTSWQIIYS